MYAWDTCPAQRDICLASGHGSWPQRHVRGDTALAALDARTKICDIKLDPR